MVERRPETPPAKNNSPLAGVTPAQTTIPPPTDTTPPSSTELSPPPASTASSSPPLRRGQRIRQPPAYLKDFICDRLQNGSCESLAGLRTERLTAKRGSYDHHGNIKICDRKFTVRAHGSDTAPQTRCSVFSYADAVKRGRK